MNTTPTFSRLIKWLLRAIALMRGRAPLINAFQEYRMVLNIYKEGNSFLASTRLTTVAYSNAKRPCVLYLLTPKHLNYYDELLMPFPKAVICSL